MLKVLLVYANAKGSGAAGSLPDYCECTAVDVNSGMPAREEIIGSDLVMVFGSSGQEALFRPVVGLCKRMHTPVTVVGSLSLSAADHTVSDTGGPVLMEFLTDFRGEAAKPSYSR